MDRGIGNAERVGHRLRYPSGFVRVGLRCTRRCFSAA